jgi:predicted DNA-binding protein (MmcQ/YjbR family)
MTVKGARDKITETVLQWQNTTAVPHRFGGTEYRFGQREIGHIHGDRLLDIPFPTAVRHELVAAGTAQPHHVLPRSGWISFTIHEPADIDKALALLQRSYDIASTQRKKRHE